MGGDSVSGNFDTGYHDLIANPKVFKTGPFLIGYTTSFRMGQLLEHVLEVPIYVAEQGTLLAYMVKTFIPAVREVLKDNGFTTVVNNVESGGSFLVAFNGQIFEVNDDFAVHQSQDGFYAVGCGAVAALGALHAVMYVPLLKMDNGEYFVECALTAASKVNMGVKDPFTILNDKD